MLQFGTHSSEHPWVVYVDKIQLKSITIDTFFNMSAGDFFMRRRKVVVTVGKPMIKEEIIPEKNPTVEDFRNASQKVLNKINGEEFLAPSKPYI